MAAACNRINVNIIYNICLFVIALANALIPHQRNIYSLAFCFFINGLACGVIETASISRILRLWGKKSGVLLQVLDCMYGVGAVIGPFSSQPFLIEMNIQEIDDSFINPFTTAQPGSLATRPQSNDKRLIFTFDNSNHTVTADDLKLVYPYSIVSSYAAVVLITSLVMFCIESQDLIHPSREEKDHCSKPPQMLTSYIQRDDGICTSDQLANSLDQEKPSSHIPMQPLDTSHPMDNKSQSIACSASSLSSESVKGSHSSYGSIAGLETPNQEPLNVNDLSKQENNDKYRVCSLESFDKVNNNSLQTDNRESDCTCHKPVDQIESSTTNTLDNKSSSLNTSEKKDAEASSSSSSSSKFNKHRFSIVICAAFAYAFTNGMGTVEQAFLVKYVTLSKFSMTSARAAAIEGSSWITHVVCGVFSIFMIQKIGLKRTLIFSAFFIGLAHALLLTTFHTGQEWVLWAVVNIMSVGSTAVFGSLVAYMECKFSVTQRESSVYLIPNSLGNMIWPALIGASIDRFPDVFIVSMVFCGFLAVILISSVIFFAEKFYPKSVHTPQIAN